MGAMETRLECAPVQRGAEAFEFPVDSPMSALLIHGWAGSPSEMRPLGQQLAAQGVAVAGVRLPGHGTSVADFARVHWSEWVTAARAAYLTLRRRYEQVLIIGFSLGGTTALYLSAAQAWDVRLAGVVTINAPVTVPRWYLRAERMRRFFGRPIIEEARLDEADPTGNARAVYYPNPPLRAALQARRLIVEARHRLAAVRAPLLVLQSREDLSINPHDAMRIIQTTGSTDKQLRWLDNAQHLTPLNRDAPVVWAEVTRFIHRLGAVPAATRNPA